MKTTKYNETREIYPVNHEKKITDERGAKNKEEEEKIYIPGKQLGEEKTQCESKNSRRRNDAMGIIENRIHTRNPSVLMFYMKF